MSERGTGQLQFVNGTVNATKYQDILENSLVPSIPHLQSGEGEFIFQQNGAACHTARSTKMWFANNNISLMTWPANSPDLLPIESLRGENEKKLRQQPSRSVVDLRAKLTEP